MQQSSGLGKLLGGGVTVVLAGVLLTNMGDSDVGIVNRTADPGAFVVIVKSSHPQGTIRAKVTGAVHVAKHYPQNVQKAGDESEGEFSDEGTYVPKTPGTVSVTVVITRRRGVDDWVSCQIIKVGATKVTNPKNDDKQTTKGKVGKPATANCFFNAATD